MEKKISARYHRNFSRFEKVLDIREEEEESKKKKKLYT